MPVNQSHDPDFETGWDEVEPVQWWQASRSPSQERYDQQLIGSNPPVYLVGLDLGQSRDFTALTVVRKTLSVVNDRPERTEAGQPVYNLLCNHVERFQLGISYPMIVHAVGALLRRPQLDGKPTLILDRTGVGRAVFDLFVQARFPCDLEAVTITSGRDVAHTAYQEWSVPKVDLIAATTAALSTGRLKFVKELPHRDTLISELMDYRVTITSSANEVFNAREGKHDDLVLALALPVWYATSNYFYSAGAAT
jgi:hypothetical protein